MTPDPEQAWPGPRWWVAADLAGVAVFAASGALAAMSAGLDLLGVVVIASVTAIGGGTVRDVLLGRYPVFWMRETACLWVILLATAVTVLAAQALPAPVAAPRDAMAHALARVLPVADALGLAVFALTGARLALQAGCPALVTLFMGTLTGTGGGVVRDLLTGRVPMILQKDVYASAALAGITLYLVLRRWRLAETAALVLGMATVVTIRLCALAWGWQFPSFSPSS